MQALTLTAEAALVEFDWMAEVRTSVAVNRFVAMVGPPGSGKTTFAKRLARELTGKDPVILQAGKETTAHKIWGSDRLRGGDSVYSPGALLRSLQEGRVLQIEEGFLLNNDVWSNFMQLRGADYVEHPVTGERIQIPANWRLIVTSNPLGRSCRSNKAVLDAMLDDVEISEIPAMDPRLIGRVLRLHFPNASEERIELVVDLWREFSERSDFERKGKEVRQPTIRNAIALLRRLEAGEDQHRAVRVALVNKLITDPEAHQAAKIRHDVAF